MRRLLVVAAIAAAGALGWVLNEATRPAIRWSGPLTEGWRRDLPVR